MIIDKEKFQKIHDKALEEYRAIGKVYCPYLKDFVFFNAKGFEHLKFKERNKARSEKDQYIRLKLITLAPKVLSQTHTLQEYFETQHFEEVRANARREKKLKQVTYYGVIAIVNSARIKVIVKQVENEQRYFLSIVPFWKIEQKNSGNKKILHAGNLEID